VILTIGEIADSEIAERSVALTGGARKLIGSRPPSCYSRCAYCTPCSPIVVNLSPDAAIWKCSCGGRVYDP